MPAIYNTGGIPFPDNRKVEGGKGESFQSIPTNLRLSKTSFGWIAPAGSCSVFLVSSGTGKASMNTLHQAR
jgi:hypothetical protein